MKWFPDLTFIAVPYDGFVTGRIGISFGGEKQYPGSFIQAQVFS